jgi:FMN phosphatase YigB (HAD superfamily)
MTNNFNNIKIIGFDLDQTLYPKSPEIDEAIQMYIYDQIAKKLKISSENAKEKFDNLYKKGNGLSINPWVSY